MKARRVWHGVGRDLAPMVALAAFLVAFPFMLPYVGGAIDTADRILDWGLFGLGFDLLFGFTGLLSFGQAAFYGVGGFVTAWLLVANVTTNAIPALVAGTLAAAIVGAAVGLLALRRAGIYFAMLTLAFGEMFYFLDLSPLAGYTGGENGLSNVPAPRLDFGLFVIDASSQMALYWLLASLFFAGFWIALRITRSPFGAVLRAIRDNGERAAALGHDVPKYKLAVFSIAAAYGGLAGGLLGLLQGFMPPDAFYLATSGQLVVQTVIGGSATLVGPLVGAGVWLYLYTFLENVAGIGALGSMILGLVFVVLVTLFRGGLVGAWVVLWRRLVPLPAALGEAAAPLELPPSARAARTTRRGETLLEASGIAKHFGGLVAVDNVSFTLKEGEVRAVIGPNGAGKSTFFGMLAKLIPPGSGRIAFAGEDVTHANATEMCQRGIAKTFQINQLFSNLTVRENLMIPALAREHGKFRAAMFRDVSRETAAARRVLDVANAVRLGDRLEAPASSLAYGEKRRLEIGLALATEPRVLLLDEPTAGMSPAERAETVQLLRRIAQGMTIVIVEHDMDVVFGLAQRITVLFNGRVIAEGAPETIQADAGVRAAYLGNPVPHEQPA
jgi:branched-chain amino acid transport system permease protein